MDQKVKLMDNLMVKFESLPERCEICHQSDFFTPKTNYCVRCSSLPPLNRDSEISVEVRTAQLFYYISGGAGIMIGFIGWKIFQSISISVDRLFPSLERSAALFIGFLVGLLIGW